MADRLQSLWADYEEHHRAAGNKWCHLLGIPLIVTGVLGLLAIEVVPLAGWPVELSLILVLAAGGAYVWLDVRLGTAMLVATLALYLGARLLDWRWATALFISGWALQFLGHGVYEKRSPAFFKNLAHLLVGPMWVLNQALRIRR